MGKWMLAFFLRRHMKRPATFPKPRNNGKWCRRQLLPIHPMTNRCKRRWKNWRNIPTDSEPAWDWDFSTTEQRRHNWDFNREIRQIHEQLPEHSFRVFG